MANSNGELTLGPVLFNWKPESWRDFYFRIADEAPLDTVYLGEVVCYKRAPFFEPLYEEVAERLTAAGKTVVFSTLSEVMLKHDRRIVASICEMEDYLVEANDASALWHLSGRPHHIGPFLNAYNEDTVRVLTAKGAKNFCLPPEMAGKEVAALCAASADLDITIETLVFGRMSLALSARCYHARAHGRTKDTCQYVCEEDPDGLDLKTLAGKPFLSINGIQTLSYDYLNLAGELEALKMAGVSRFRLSPHSVDMVATARAFGDILDGKADPEKAAETLKGLGIEAPLSNGFFHGKPGYRYIPSLERPH